MPREIPIIFRPDMAHKIRMDQKHQTRRPVRKRDRKNPYGERGDVLWVKEPWYTKKSFDGLKPSELPALAPIWYRADLDNGVDVPKELGRYRHARFMPKRFSRTKLIVTATGRHALLDIDENDAREEGLEVTTTCGGHGPGTVAMRVFGWLDYSKPYKTGLIRASVSFLTLWDKLYAGTDLESKNNPDVWAVEFMLHVYEGGSDVSR